MAKNKSFYVCGECGYKSSKWMGKCLQCNEWGTFEEEIEITSAGAPVVSSAVSVKETAEKVYSFSDIKIEDMYRYKTGVEEFDRVLGGGLLQGEVVLVTGNPGIGKSTLLLQVADKYTSYGTVIYISGEESPSQVKNRGERLKINAKDLFLMAETDVSSIYEYLIAKKPKVVIVDSIQTLYNSSLDSIPGTPTQIRECTLKIIELAKKYNISFFIVGHITKDGKVAGPKMLEHMVDAVFNFEGEEGLFYRILRSTKNRFGSTNELGVFEMKDVGLVELTNPSQVLISEKPKDVSGSVIIYTVEGTRPMLLELQALVAPTNFGMARRTSTGVDFNSVALLLAVLEKRIGLQIQNQDVYINVVGGIKINEPSIDLGIVIAVASSFRNIPIASDVVVTGEVGLTGEIRAVSYIEKRIAECKKLGFKKIVIPRNNYEAVKDVKGIEIIPVDNLRQAINIVLRG